MASEGRFVYTASEIDGHLRSSWNMNNSFKSSVYHGYLTPLDICFVMPGDSFDVDLSAVIRTATNPIYPIMDRIKGYFAAFFVPKRLLWNRTKEFYLENTEGYGIQSEVLEPRDNSGKMILAKSDFTSYPKSISAALGLIAYNRDNEKEVTAINLNYIRSFFQCYNDWFRNENFDAPFLWNHNETGDNARYAGSIGGAYVDWSTDLPKVCKNLDLFTACLPWTQKLSAPVSLPLGDRAVVKLVDSSEAAAPGANLTPKMVGLNLDDEWQKSTPESTVHLNASSEFAVPTDEGVGQFIDPKGSLYADLRNATAANVNQLRMAIATQRYFETLARTGSKYREYIKAMFGVSIGDTTAQMAEYLGGFSVDINVNQVVSTADYSAGSSNKIGALGAVSCTGLSQKLFRKSFVEPGYVVIVMYTKHDRTYGQGIDEFLLKHELFDEYNPKFAFTGEVPVKKGRVMFTGNQVDDDATLGFNEYGNEYRSRPDVVRGYMNPALTSSYDFTNLSEDFGTTQPTLSSSFLKEDRAAITRCLAGGESSPDYFVDCYIQRKVARPMPLYSIPGLMDHF